MGGAVYMSSNFGNYWTDISDGLEKEAISSLAICGQYIYAGTWDKGLWKRPLSDILGVNELGIRNEELGIKVYPNPVNSLLVVSYSLLGKSNVKVGIYDVTGREMDELGIRNEELGIRNEELGINGEHRISYDAGKLRSGVYFVRIVSDEGVGVRKFVKE